MKISNAKKKGGGIESEQLLCVGAGGVQEGSISDGNFRKSFDFECVMPDRPRWSEECRATTLEPKLPSAEGTCRPGQTGTAESGETGLRPLVNASLTLAHSY